MDFSKEYDFYKGLLSIDKHGLDNEFSEFAVHYQNMCEILSTLSSAHERKKAQFVAAQVTIADAIRNDSAEKISDTKMAILLPADPRYIEMQDDVLIAKSLYNKWSMLKDSFDQKSRAIKELAALFIAGYWAVNAGGAPTAARKEIDAQEGREALKAARIEKAERKVEQAPVKEEVKETAKSEAPVVKEEASEATEAPVSSVRSRLRAERLNRTSEAAQPEQPKEEAPVEKEAETSTQDVPVRRGLRRSRS